MGKRREPRKEVQLPVRVFGTDASGRIFSESAATLDISQNGVKLGGIKAHVAKEEIIGLTYQNRKVHFRVKWVGEPGSPREGQIGLLNLSPEKPLWDVALPPKVVDNFIYSGTDRRKFPRVKCAISVEIQPPGQSVIWAKASDLSLGGCFIEMPIPMPVGAAFEVALWLGPTKLRLRAKAVSSAPGFGNGLSFLKASPDAIELLQRHISSLESAAQAVSFGAGPSSAGVSR
jgi:hypothetical protein